MNKKLKHALPHDATTGVMKRSAAYFKKLTRTLKQG
jgi:hypothetical protein